MTSVNTLTHSHDYSIYFKIPIIQSEIECQVNPSKIKINFARAYLLSRYSNFHHFKILFKRNRNA